MSDVAPGWYSGPSDPLQERFWDGATWTDQVRPRPPLPRIGDVGPGGGRIFITPSTIGNSTGQYFEAAPYADEVLAKWCSDSDALLGASGTSIGTGATNTAIAAATCIDGACKIASKYSNNGFSDWFLPSKDELNALYGARDYLGGFSTDCYWSSSEGKVNGAWEQHFGEGGSVVGIMLFHIDLNYVRPVRAFS